MNQTETLKSLLADYRAGGGNLADLDAASAYLNTYKPAGMGRVTPAICGALSRQPPMLPEAPPAISEPAPIVIATKTVTFPEVMRPKPQAVYFESPPQPEPMYDYGEPPLPPVPASEPAKSEADPVALPPAPEKIAPPKKSWIAKMKFW